MGTAPHRALIKSYTTLLTSDRLDDCLAEIDRQTQERFERLRTEEGITEQLKADIALEWVGRLNIIRARAMEIVNKKIIFA